MALPCVRLSGVWSRPRLLSRYLYGNVRHQASAAVSADNEEIVIPRKKSWSKTAILQALAHTVNHDPTAAHYRFQDDPYLIPRTSSEFRLYSLSKESGKNAAKYVFNTYPKLFENDVAEPHIPCLMPEYLQPQIEGVSEEALNERIRLRRVKDSVDLFDQLLQGGAPPSIETTNRLLDLLCFYGDREPAREGQVEQREDENDNVEEAKKQTFSFRKTSDNISTWRENNNAERIFNLMPERNAHSFCTMIRGMVKHGSPSKAFNMYTDLLNGRMSADVYTFNALILAAPEIKEKYNEKWDLIAELLKHMVEQKVRPNLLTFNSVLKSLRKCGMLARGLALQTLNEMKALGIEPSLASFNHILGVFYKTASSSRGQTEILAEVLDELEGKSFTAQDPDDMFFFASAMRVCLDQKDIELAYRVHALLQTGDNWRLMGDPYLQSTYYGRFFNLLCMMENIDTILKWYRELIPSLYYPNSRGMMDLLQALDMDSRLDLIPQIWKDIKQIGHSNKVELVEEVLNIMTRDKQAPEVQAAFADTAVDIKSLYEMKDRMRIPLEWTSGSLGNVCILLSRAGRAEEAWKMLKSFKSNNRVPSPAVIEVFLTSAKTCGSSNLAVDLVQLAASFSLQNTAELAKRVMEEFSLSEEQRINLEDLQTQSSTSSSSSESSDSDRE
ncbi:pentatricopeptide repeat domain-containing protein 3, mitochondrial [Bombina bombina]|uniref:pentatricopeptide repeat domain-containing protein 3, mitochondrial n=1 Tax=Bombina bombina TaxID=8345 RepID=UPI00235ADECD|nr:pentatricopeptide repeat domain-containing protein 3, mitochondrial [Bombina bombina]